MEGLAVDDVSISDDSVSDCEEIDDDSGSVSELHQDNGRENNRNTSAPNPEDNIQIDDDHDDASAGSSDEFGQWFGEIGSRISTQSRSSSSQLQRVPSASPNSEIIILDSDDENNDDDDAVIVHRTSSSSSRSTMPQFRKVSNETSTVSRANSRNSKRTKKMNKDKPSKVERKYKLLKKKLAAMKHSMAEQQAKNKERLEFKSENEELKLERKAQSIKFEKEVYGSRHDKRQLAELRLKIDSIQKERDLLRDERLKESTIHKRERERMKDIAESSKTSSMAEMKMIIRQNQDLKKENEEVIDEWKSMSQQKKQTEKVNAKLKRQLNELAEEELVENIERNRNAKPQSRTKMVELFRHGNKEADDARAHEEEEFMMQQKEKERKNMIRKSSSQMGRVLAAATKQQKRKTRPSFVDQNVEIGSAVAATKHQKRKIKPSFMDQNAAVKKDSRRSLATSALQPKRTTITQRMRPDIRNMFKKK